MNARIMFAIAALAIGVAVWPAAAQYPKVPKELLEIVNGCVRKGQAAGVLLGELERLGVRATKAPRQ